MPLKTFLLAGLLLIVAAGCAGPGGKTGYLPQPPKQPAPPPPAHPQPIDENLILDANRELTAALSSSDAFVRAHALEAIRDTNALSLSANHETDARPHAIQAIRAAGAATHRREVIAALGDHESIVRFAAAMAAGELVLDEAHAPLLQMVDDPSENVRVAVRFALHRLGDTSLSHQLEALARDHDERVRANTAYVLGLLHEPSALPILRALRKDPSVPVRQQASEAMWQLGDQEGLKDLVGLTVSRFPDDQIVGLLGLAMPRRREVRQHIRAGLVSEDTWPQVPLVAARAMGMLGSDEGFGIAQTGAASSDPHLRTLAALALGAIGRTDAQGTLRPLLRDGDPDVRIAAAAAILQLRQGT